MTDRRKTAPFWVVLACVLTLPIAFTTYRALADQTYFSPGLSANVARPCDFSGVTTQVVTTSGTSAATSSNTGIGAVRIVCTTDTHMREAVSGAAGPTAITGDTLLPMWAPEYFYSQGGKFAFVQDSSGGTCYVSSCQ
jgi:hypothetical protein